MVVNRHCQHTFQYNQLVKVRVTLYDPLKFAYPGLENTLIPKMISSSVSMHT